MIKLGDREYQTPFEDVVPPLTEEEASQLRADIAQRGILVPIVIDEYGNILDGHHRLSIAAELSEAKQLKLAQIQWDIRPGLTDDEKRNLARDLNIHRRHLTPEQWQALQLRRNGKTYEAIGEELGVSKTSAYRIAKSTEISIVPENETIEKSVSSKDGRKYPKKQQTSIFALDTRQAQKTLDSLQGINPDVLPDKTMTAQRAQRVIREAKKEQQAEETDVTVSSAFDLRFGDFREVLADLPDASIDLIFTDPPYPKKYLPLWSDLAQLAARVLKPGKLLIAYSGQFFLPEVMAALGEHLEYVWLGSLVMLGAHNQVQHKKIRNACKPLLFYARKPFQPYAWIDDLIENASPDKNLHEWQQGIDPARQYIERLTQLGETVLDPFAGSGTTGVAAVELHRHFIGAEIKVADYKVTFNRIRSAIIDDAQG